MAPPTPRGPPRRACLPTRLAGALLFASWAALRLGSIHLAAASFYPNPNTLELADGVGMCYLDADHGRVKCWGEFAPSEFHCLTGIQRAAGATNGTMGAALPYVDLGTDALAATLVQGGAHTCAVLSDGRVKCWGLNDAGQLFLGDVAYRGCSASDMGDALPAADFGSNTSVVSVALGDRHTCAILADTVTGGVGLKCAGYNPDGRLGYRTVMVRSPAGDALPYVDLGTGQQPLAVAAGALHTCVVLASGIKCFGAPSSLERGRAQ